MDFINENRVNALLSGMLAERLGFSPTKARQIRIAASLHDIGKLKLPHGLINKPGKLSTEEFEVMKTHTKLGADLFSSVKGDIGEVVRGVCLWHHEKWDSSGYWGMKAAELPAYIPIVSVVDVFTALVSARVYKRAWLVTDALEYIKNQAGKQFGGELVEAFLSLIYEDGVLETICNTLEGVSNISGR